MKNKIIYIFLILGFLFSPLLFGQTTSLITLSNGATITADGSGVEVCADDGSDGNNQDDFIELNSGTFCFKNTPVTLTSFATVLSDNNVVLNWNTATELANYGFEVQRSVVSSQKSEKEWEKIGFIEGHGNSNSSNDYSFIDTNPPSGTVEYRLKQMDVNGSSKYYYTDAIEIEAPKVFKLVQNYPNPFNPTTVITYSIPNSSDVTLRVYNTIGEAVATLVNQHQEAGKFNVTFNATNLPSGIYFYSIQAGQYSNVKKMLLLK